MSQKTLAKIILLVLVLLIISFIIWLMVYRFNEVKAVFSLNNRLQASIMGGQASIIETPLLPENLKPSRDWSVQDLEIAAKAAICIEVDSSGQNKVLLKKNESEQLPIASLTKLMSALIVLENYGLDQVTVVSQEAVDQPGEQGLLTVNQYLSIENLLYIMLIESSNDAAYNLAELVGEKRFVELMNLGAQKIGLTQTHFVDPAGLSPSNISTVEDIVKLTKYLLEKEPLVFEILSKNEYALITPQKKLDHLLINTNELLGKIPNIVGGKTGNTAEAKGCLMLIVKNQRDDNNLIYVVLGSKDRFGEMQQLIDWANQAYKW